jgi:nucleoside-diphosphate-sugar epimerase
LGTAKKRVFLTGATGNMGVEVLREFVRRSDRFDVTALVLPTERERAVIAEFADEPSVTVRYGDVTSYEHVESCVARADVVAHIGALVSPYADEHPAATTRVNVGGARNIIAAVKARPDPASIGVIMIGSVAEFGDRNPPLHRGRVGDPLAPSEFDNYAQSKISAERALVDSGLPRWAWLRQTGIFHPGMLAIRDAIMLHVPLGGVIEWVSAEDSARLVANACEDDAPEEFWGGVYDVGGGAGWRLTNWEFQSRIGRALGVRDIRKWYDRNWFATQNFHGLWYTDSDALDDLLHFRSGTFEQALGDAVARQGLITRLASLIPPWLVKGSVIAPLSRGERGPMSWIRDGDDAHIRAYFGSRRQWEAIGDWSSFVPPEPSATPVLLEHGYDESVPRTRWKRSILQAAARFRGGALVGSDSTVDHATPVDWSCADGHRFSGSPRLVLGAGHWCPTCVTDTAGFERQAERSPFLAQLFG